VLSGSSREYQPYIALRLRPADAFAAAQVAARLDANAVQQQATIEELAKVALLRDPTAVEAARAVALERAAQGKSSEAATVAMYASRLSKRDLPTELWLMNYYLDRGDLRRMLQHFDAAASTSTSATAVLFPLMGSALYEPQMIEPLAQLLAKGPAWTPSLLDTLAQGAGPPENDARLFIRLAQLGNPPRDDITERLVQRLQQDGKGALAAQLARSTGLSSPATSTRPDR